MINPLLLTFIAVVDEGSFTKASEKLYLSPTAVMKQMNALETHLNLKLIDRTKGGISLTEPGEIIYEKAKFMVDYSNTSIMEARARAAENVEAFCIGNSLLNPAKPFIDLWNHVGGKFSNYNLHLVLFEDSKEGILNEISLLGIKFDFIVGICDSSLWKSKCNFQPVGTYKKMIAVNHNHRLAKYSSIKVEDLEGETLMMVDKGDSKVNDFLRNDLETNHPDILIEDVGTFYDMSVFNECEATDKVLLTTECWKNVHPGLVTIPVEWDYEIPYGLLYALNPPADILEFVEKVRKLTKTNS